MNLASRDFISGQDLPPKCTSEGGNVSPSLVFQNTPHGAQSLVVIMKSVGLAENDGDYGQGKIHWIVWNIPANIDFIPSGFIPSGAVVGLNDYWEAGYSGPYPPAGEKHKYITTAYALDTSLRISTSSSYDQLFEAIKNHILDQDSISCFYQRK